MVEFVLAKETWWKDCGWESEVSQRMSIPAGHKRRPLSDSPLQRYLYQWFTVILRGDAGVRLHNVDGRTSSINCNCSLIGDQAQEHR